VEDQQPATGDLTEESAVDPAVAETETAPVDEPDVDASDVDVSDESDPESDESVTESVDGATGDDELESDEGVIQFRERRPVSKWSAIASAVAAALFVGSAAFAGATVQPYLTDRATVATKLRVARTAANAITTLWTYTPQNIDKLADRASQYLSGDFEAAYRKYIDALVAPNKQAQISNTTQVTGAAVESLTASDATAIVYTNTASTNPTTKDVPSLKYLSYRLVLQRDHARWLVTKMTTVTSLDLTPKF
jgi:Mce-associated membrane protein